MSFFQNEINILLFKGNVTHTVLHQNEIYSSIQDVIFGVAILDKNKVSSGIRWQDPCRYKKDYGIIKYCIVKINNFDTYVIAMILTQINWRSCVFLWRCKMYFRLSLITLLLWELALHLQTLLKELDLMYAQKLLRLQTIPWLLIFSEILY